jgi:ribosomal protein S18 acetylase RimI-like enzyme
VTIIEAPIRRLDIVDLPECQELAIARGWGPGTRLWAMLFRMGEVYAVPDPFGGLAACAVLTKQGDGLAVVSMVLVAARFERQGLGRRVMRHVLEQAGARTVMLHSSTLGRPLYDKLGFRQVSSATRHTGSLAAGPLSTRGAAAADLPALRRLDAEVTDADRSVLLDVLLAEAEQVRVVETGGEITGYAAGTGHDGVTVIGPVIAADESGARALIADIATITGPIRIELDSRHPGLLKWAGEAGLVPGMVAPCLVRGDRPMAGDPSRRYAPIMRALG